MATVSIQQNPNLPQSTGQTPKPLGLNLVWDKDEKAQIKTILGRYPKEQSRSALIPLLKLAQHKCGGWLPVDGMQLVAETLELPYIRVFEVASFYTMFNLKPVGKFHIQVCTNCSCLIRGSDAVLKAAHTFAGTTKSGETSQDGLFTVTEVECLGACVDAPMAQVGTHYYTKLDAEKTTELLKHLKEGEDPAKPSATQPGDVDPIHFGNYQERV